MANSRMSARERFLLFGDDTLQAGDAVVHFEHGLACYGGAETVELGDETQRLQVFVYREGGKLLLPAELGKDFWLYGAPAKDVVLDRLDSDAWSQRRDEMIVELREAGKALIARSKERRALASPRIRPSDEVMARAAETFGYEETPDQARAITAVLDDLSKGAPMDRLLIGDVGFGKTEVALRACAATLDAGLQTIFAAPTTVLARQHAQTLKARFGEDSVAEVSRLVPEAERANVLAAIASGAARIVVGTHGLLAEDVTFAEVGLLVIDEEQRFGLDEKLDLRARCAGAHVLSMTATPIPRTLAAAQIGLIDVSVIATAPETRLPVQTSLMAFDAAAVEEAVAKETARGGQTFIVCPRVKTARAVSRLLERRGANFSHLLAHGQLDDAELEGRMLAFMSGESDVLISTTIIESGLDNPRANTMIVIDAELLGLAQLHQLRGRIGRGETQARMILMSDIDPSSDEQEEENAAAIQRLTAFTEMSEIGAGFRIALADRNLRGFGEIDGDEQSGHMSRLGVGLYRHVLTEVAREQGLHREEEP